MDRFPQLTTLLFPNRRITNLLEAENLPRLEQLERMFYKTSDLLFKHKLKKIQAIVPYGESLETDPITLVAQAGQAGAFVLIDGGFYFRDAAGSVVAFSATQLRILADELDRLNGVVDG
jgi:hypothetical protein